MRKKPFQKQSEKSVLHRFGLAIKKRREQRGWTQYEFADKSALDQTYISLIERGKPNPTFLVVTRLAAGLKMPTSKLCAGLERVG